jgi:thiamine monophosphate synthase
MLTNSILNLSLYLVADPKYCRLSLEKTIELAIQGGVTAVQLRDKTATEHEILTIGKRLKKILKTYRVPLIINDHIAVANFFTPRKLDAAAQLGVEGLRKLYSVSNHRMVAIGGIDKSNAKDVLAVGVNGIAVVSAICASEFPRQATQQLKRIVNAAMYARTNNSRI